MFVWQGIRPNILRFSCMLSPSICRCDKMSDLTSLGSATCWAQVHVNLIRYQKQTSLGSATLSSSTCGYRKMLDLNIIGFNYALSPSVCRSNKMLGSTILGSVTRWAKIDVSLVRCQAHNPWLWNHSKLGGVWFEGVVGYFYGTHIKKHVFFAFMGCGGFFSMVQPS